ncbi:hypothetical protein IJG78_02240 [Candidatus Saccharibacteria bacterium]|nr:hypothetical protein [Candidatus Saccharibacteria bacterium]
MAKKVPLKRYYSYPEQPEPLNFPVEPIAHGFSVFVILLCLFLVFGNAIAHVVFNPETAAKRELEKLAKDYYENYYYDSFTENTPESELAIAFQSYEDYGFPPVYLRQLLLFDDERHAESRSYFSGQYFCNTNHTSVTFLPHAPYGKTDYTVNYKYDCEWDIKK